MKSIDHEGYLELYRSRLAALDSRRALAFGAFCAERLWLRSSGPATLRSLARELIDEAWKYAGIGLPAEEPASGFPARLRAAALGLDPRAPEVVAAGRIAMMAHIALEGTSDDAGRVAALALEFTETASGCPPGDWRDHAPDRDSLQPPVQAEYDVHVAALERLRDSQGGFREALRDLLDA